MKRFRGVDERKGLVGLKKSNSLSLSLYSQLLFAPLEVHLSYPLRQRLLGRREVGPAHVELHEVPGGRHLELEFFSLDFANDVESSFFVALRGGEAVLIPKLVARGDALERCAELERAKRKKKRARERLAREPALLPRKKKRGAIWREGEESDSRVFYYFFSRLDGLAFTLEPSLLPTFLAVTSSHLSLPLLLSRKQLWSTLT